MSKTAQPDHPIHDLIARRWSPRAFADRDVATGDLARLFEAARWASSAFNEQPWRFVVGTRDQGALWQRLFDCLVPGNQSWCRHAPVLVLTAVSRQYAHNGKRNHHAWHDLGLAVGNLVLQATELDLAVHQMAGFDAQVARETFAIPETFEPVTMMAIGHVGDPSTLEADWARDAETAPRTRKPLDEIVFGDDWGAASPIASG